MTALARRFPPRRQLTGALAAAVLGLLVVGPAARAADAPDVAVDGAGNARFAWQAPVGANQVVFERGLAGSTLGDTRALSFTNQSSRFPEVAVTPDGTATFVWERFDSGVAAVQAVRRFTDGSLGPVHVLVGSNAVLGGTTRVAVDPAGNATFAWLRTNAEGDDIVQTRRLEADGTLTTAQGISSAGEDAADPELAAGANGDVVFAWRRFDGNDNIVQTRRRAAGGGFSAVQDLSEPGRGAVQPDVAVDDDGDSTFIWVRTNGTNLIAQTRRRTAAGTLGEVQDLSAPGQSATQPAVAVDPDDDAAFTWFRSNGSNNVIQSRFRTPEGTLGSVQTISASGQNAANPRVGMDTAGNATFAWIRNNGTHSIAQTRRRPAGGSFSTTQNLSLAGASAADPQLAVAPGGDAVFAWVRSAVVQGRRRAAAGGFGPILDVGS
jgi:hypothetical protein